MFRLSAGIKISISSKSGHSTFVLLTIDVLFHIAKFAICRIIKLNQLVLNFDLLIQVCNRITISVCTTL